MYVVCQICICVHPLFIPINRSKTKMGPNKILGVKGLPKKINENLHQIDQETAADMLGRTFCRCLKQGQDIKRCPKLATCHGALFDENQFFYPLSNKLDMPKSFCFTGLKYKKCFVALPYKEAHIRFQIVSGVSTNFNSSCLFSATNWNKCLVHVAK